MFLELPINNGTQIHRAFLLDSFFHPEKFSSLLHKHAHAECHAILGTAVYWVGKKEYTLANGDVLFIPKNEMHYCTHTTPNTLRISFQIDLDIDNTCVKNVGEALINNLLEEIEKCQKSGHYAGVARYISMICDAFEVDPPLHPTPITDYGFLIREFFTLYYNKNINLSNLAAILHLSERQTERQVIAHTGKSFKKELVEIRMSMAKYLQETTDMSLSAIAEYVGYSSYAGFWKAFRQYESTNQQ